MMNYRKISFEFALDFKPLLYLLNYTTQNQMKTSTCLKITLKNIHKEQI